MAIEKFRAIGSSTLSMVDNTKRKEILVNQSFDEQIQFLNAKGAQLSNIEYIITLEDGSVVDGVTDKLGRTKRIRTSSPISIKQAKLHASPVKMSSLSSAKISPSISHSCSAHPTELPNFLTIQINDIKTNSLEIGTSVAEVKTPGGESRGMTPGEIAMARMLFKDSVDYTEVRLHNGEYLWLGMQPNDTAMTPEGEIYFNKKAFREDFSCEDEQTRLWIMHEMVHVWQYQLGYPVKLRGAVRIGLDYAYTLKYGKLLYDYNMEAQGDLLSDYWALLDAKADGRRPRYMNQRKHVNDTKLYEQVLKHFIQDPSRSINLPFG